MIFEIPEEGIKDPQTGILIRRDNYISAIEAANTLDTHKIYQRRPRELRLEQQAAGSRGKNFNKNYWRGLTNNMEPENAWWNITATVPARARTGPYMIKVKIINKQGTIVSRSYIEIADTATLEEVTKKLALGIEREAPEKQAEFLKACNEKPA